ncbi:MAG: MBL fold metallo-hydrolase [Chitinophagales bacterium]|nr:MBL fold metallo-hydrolase [Chitinophagales bacterium]
MKRIVKITSILIAIIFIAIGVKIATLGEKIDFSLLSKFVYHDDLKNEKSVNLKYFGTSCFAFTYNGETYLTDPFYSNPNIGQLLTGKYDDRSDLIEKFLGELDDVSLLSISHGHYDHCLDFSSFVTKYDDSLKIVTSQSTLNELNPEIKKHPTWQKVPINDNKNEHWIYSKKKNFRIFPVEGFHQPHFANFVLASGTYNQPLGKMPAQVWQWEEGGTNSFVLDIMNRDEIYVRYFIFSGGLKEQGKAKLIELAKEHPVDILFAAYFDERHTDHPLDELFQLLQPKEIIMHHWNDFFSSPYKEVRKLRNSKIEKVLIEKSEKKYPVSVMMPFTEINL